MLTPLLKQAKDLLHTAHVEVATDREVLEPTVHGQQTGLGKASVGDAGREADVSAEVDVAGDQDFAGIDHQDVRTNGGFLRADVGALGLGQLNLRTVVLRLSKMGWYRKERFHRRDIWQLTRAVDGPGCSQQATGRSSF